MLRTKLKLVAFSVLVLVFFGGCVSTNNIEVKQPVQQTLKKDKAYIQFVSIKRPLREFDCKIFEVDVTTNKVKYLGNFSAGESYVQEVNPGKHYYYIVPERLLLTPGARSFIEVNVNAGDYKYVSGFGTILYERRNDLLSSLKTLECNDFQLKRYGFALNQNNKMEKWENELFSISITCENGKISSIQDERRFNNDDIKGSKIVIPSTKDILKYYQNNEINDATLEDIQNGKFYLISDFTSRIEDQKKYVDLHKNLYAVYQPAIRLTERYSMEILQATTDEFAYKFDGFTIAEKTINNQQLAEELKQAMSNDLKTLYKDDAPIEISFNVINYIEGSQAQRYFGLTNQQRIDGMSSLQIDVIFKEKATGKQVGAIRYISGLASGVFGGSGFIADASKHITDYARMSFTKK